MKRVLAAATALLLALTTRAALAAPIVIQDTVDVAATRSGADYGAFASGNFANQVRDSRHWGDEIADNPRFNTTRITVDRNYAANTVDIVMRTMFDGNDVAAGVKYADLFLSTTSTAFGAAPDYAIALGYQSIAAGVYTVGSLQTSNDIWAGRGQWVYGGYAQPNASADNYDPTIAYASPTRLTGGTQLSDMMVTVTRTVVDSSVFDVAVHIASTDSIALFENFAIFWGTGDCSNDAIAGVVGAPVNAPGAVSLFGLGFAILALMPTRRRRR